MHPALSPTLRIDFTRRNFALSSAAMSAWAKQFSPARWSVHRSQIKAISNFLCGLAEALRADCDGLKEDDPLEQVYHQCRLLDQGTLWLERALKYLGRPFEQRVNGPEQVQDVLAAADEVLWSCYRLPFDRVGARRGPTPLPYLEPRYSPGLFSRQAVPEELAAEVGALKEPINALPLAFVRLPPICAVAPWWLVLIAHEVGHHVQFEILPENRLVRAFAGGIENAVQEAGASETEVDKWGQWSEEIFADLFSVCCMGRWALRMLLEVEIQPRAAMVQERDHYPPAWVRLQLVARAADRLTETADAQTMLAMYAEQAPEVKRDLDFIDPVLEYALGPLPELDVRLDWMCAFDPADFSKDGPVSDWAERLRKAQTFPIPNDLLSARRLACAALEASLGLNGLGEQVALCRKTIEAIQTSSTGGVRAGEKESDIRGIIAAAHQMLLGTMGLANG